MEYILKFYVIDEHDSGYYDLIETRVQQDNQLNLFKQENRDILMAESVRQMGLVGKVFYVTICSPEEGGGQKQLFSSLKSGFLDTMKQKNSPEDNHPTKEDFTERDYSDPSLAPKQSYDYLDKSKGSKQQPVFESSTVGDMTNRNNNRTLNDMEMISYIVKNPNTVFGCDATDEIVYFKRVGNRLELMSLNKDSLEEIPFKVVIDTETDTANSWAVADVTSLMSLLSGLLTNRR